MSEPESSMYIQMYYNNWIVRLAYGYPRVEVTCDFVIYK